MPGKATNNRIGSRPPLPSPNPDNRKGLSLRDLFLDPAWVEAAFAIAQPGQPQGLVPTRSLSRSSVGRGRLAIAQPGQPQGLVPTRSLSRSSVGRGRLAIAQPGQPQGLVPTRKARSTSRRGRAKTFFVAFRLWWKEKKGLGVPCGGPP